MKVAIYTLGCKVNQYETEAMAEAFLKKGYQIADFNDLCDVYVVNSCTVTSTGDKKTRQVIHRLHRQNVGVYQGRSEGTVKFKSPQEFLLRTFCDKNLSTIGCILSFRQLSAIIKKIGQNPRGVVSCIDKRYPSGRDKS